MKIVSIFAPYLFAFQYEDEEINEFDRLLLKEWTSFVGLEDFFANNPNVLTYKKLTLDDAIAQTRRTAREMYASLKANQTKLDELFENLTPSTTFENLDEQEYKKEWLRLYAIMLESGHYIITGGAIKQSQKMQDHPLTVRELSKLKRCLIFLKSQGVTDIETFSELNF